MTHTHSLQQYAQLEQVKRWLALQTLLALLLVVLVLYASILLSQEATLRKLFGQSSATSTPLLNSVEK